MLKTSILFIFTTIGILSAQNYQKEGTFLQFHPEFSGKALLLGDSLIINNHKITIDHCKIYIGQVVLYNKNNKVWAEENSFHLLDLSNPTSLNIQLATPENLSFDAIQFQLGLDSLTNVSGAMGGDLDPTKGMYWTWQSGYINLKIEGYCETCPTRNHIYEFHLGGYMPPYQTVQSIQLKVDMAKNLHIGMELKRFLEPMDLTKQCAIMSPGTEAQRLSKLANTIFYAHSHE